MRVNGRKSATFQNNHLKKSHDLPQDRFCDLARTESITRLERLADVRNAVVIRGKALIANPNYPGPEIIWKISHLLARKMC